uniref:Secreted protein n=1 Tax=Arundo donax TaxID=35708 RepID=A0A0A9GEW7_ARUDO
MSFTVMGLTLPPLLLALIMRPRRSLAHPSSFSSPVASCRRPMSVTRFFLISLSSFQELVFFRVGKNLYPGMKTLRNASEAKAMSCVWSLKTALPSS